MDDEAEEGQASSTSAAAPSAITNPSRVVSNGREARCGSGSVDNARIRENAINDQGFKGASDAPARTMSASPYLTAIRGKNSIFEGMEKNKQITHNVLIRKASPIEWSPEAHAVLQAIVGPRRPQARLICATGILARVRGSTRAPIPE